MLSARFKPWHVPGFFRKYVSLRLRKMPVLVHFEVTLRCNARCGFCDYWKTDASEKERELKSYVDAARFFNPMLVCFTGGEPLLRRDLEDLVAGVDRAISWKYMTLITHGAMLTAERGKALKDAGINQISISLDYLDERHDEARGIPGLSRKIFDAVEGMRALGLDNIRFNTVIKHDNIDQIRPMVARAAELGCGVNFSVYTDFKNGNREHLLSPEQQGEIEALTADLLAYKRRRRGVITNSDHYLENLPRYTSGAMTEPCESGISTIHVDPTGGIRRCPDFPVDFHWTEWKRYTPIDCNRCYYACRGEAQAPLRIDRIRDVMA